MIEREEMKIYNYTHFFLLLFCFSSMHTGWADTPGS